MSEEYMDDFIRWISPTYNLSQDSNSEAKPVTKKPKLDYILWVGICSDREGVNDDQVKINVCKRRNDGFKLEEKDKTGERLFYKRDTKQNIENLRTEICDIINKIFPNRIYIPHTQGSKILVPNDKIDKLKEEILSKNN